MFPESDVGVEVADGHLLLGVIFLVEIFQRYEEGLNLYVVEDVGS